MVERKRIEGPRLVAFAAALIATPLATACAPPVAPRHADIGSDAITTRTLAWPGGDRLFVAANADVRYTPGDANKMVITGPADEVDDLVVDDGVIGYGDDHWRWGWGWGWWGWRGWRSSEVHVVVTAPQVNEAGVSGSGHLDLGRLTQDRLDLSVSGSGALDASGQFKSLNVSLSGSGAARLGGTGGINVGDMTANLSGSGWIRAAGAADTLHLAIFGSGAADMGALTVQDVDARLAGSGGASLSPKKTADVDVFGSGAVRLLTEPAQLNAHRAGSGAIIHPGGFS